MPQPPMFPTPEFTESTIQSGRTDGYWVETFLADPADRYPGIIAYGSKTGDVCVFDNPNNHNSPQEYCAKEPPEPSVEWTRYLVAKFNTPVAVAVGDCAGNGLMDIIICHDYGAPKFLEASPAGGHLSWMRNPGRNKDGTLQENWGQQFIGRWPSMHRLKAGHFTQRSMLEIVALPIIRGPQDKDTPVPIFLFQRNETATKTVEWKRSIIDDERYTIIHDCATKRFEAHTGLDSLFIASREGVNWLYYEDGQWRKHLIHEGMAKEPGKDFYGSGCVDVGRVGNDPAAYMMTIDPFHGGVVSALTKRKTGLKTHHWVRRVLDMYGNPEQLQNKGDGPGHYVVTGDFDGDGDDECLVALFGPLLPHKGVYYYKAIDVERGLFAKWRVSRKSAARIAIGNFSPGKGLDFATIEYTDQEEHPKIHLYTHNFSIADVDAESSVISTLWDNRPLYYVPRPTAITAPQTAPLMEVAEYRIHLEIYPPNYISVEPVWPCGDAIQVLWGQINDGDIPRRGLGIPQYKKGTSKIQNRTLYTGNEGAIFLRFTPIGGAVEGTTKGFPDAETIPVKSLFKFTHARVQLAEGLKFIKVECLDWANGDFDGLLFYNMTGIHFRFLDDTPLCHVQFWTAAKTVSAGAHNHEQDFFLEVHLSLWTGTKEGGMWYVKPGVPIPKPPEKPESLPPEAYNKIPLDSLEHHGALWDMKQDGRPVMRSNGSVQYPYHKWQAGNKGENIDIWVAVEFNPYLALDLQRATS